MQSLVIEKKTIYLNKKHFDSKILQDKLLYIHYNFTIKVYLPQIINTKQRENTKKYLKKIVKKLNIKKSDTLNF